VLPFTTGLFSGLYLVAALVLGGAFCGLALQLAARPARARALRVYLYSLAYLALLFTAMALDRVF
jgi:protoheme IX farnesyltransferase